jgi:hypothetical protein
MNIYKIYVSTASSLYSIAKSIVASYKWMGGQNYRGEPWMVIDLYYKTVTYTWQPPNTKDLSILVATTPTDIMSQISSLASPYVAPISTALPEDPYLGTLTLVY